MTKVLGISDNGLVTPQTSQSVPQLSQALIFSQQKYTEITFPVSSETVLAEFDIPAGSISETSCLIVELAIYLTGNATLQMLFYLRSKANPDNKVQIMNMLGLVDKWAYISASFVKDGNNMYRWALPLYPPTGAGLVQGNMSNPEQYWEFDFNGETVELYAQNVDTEIAVAAIVAIIKAKQEAQL